MTKIEKDDDREYRIDMEIVVDAYDSQERAMGWYYYVADHCNYPFKARCIETRRISPLEINEEVEVLSITEEAECEKEIFVEVKWNNRDFAIPFSQLEGIDVDGDTKQVLEDWRYWRQRGYEF